MEGSPGYGKTTLALGLCHDPEIATAFFDGILWVMLGPEPDLLREFEILHLALTDQSSGDGTVQDAAHAVAAVLRDRRCLIVVDDVWDESDLRLFLRG